MQGSGDLIITAESSTPDYDFVVRCFVPEKGNKRGRSSRIGPLRTYPFWAARTGKNSFRSFQMSDRTGELFVRMVGERIEVSGRAITFSKAR
ncbi:MAG: hypothetical protein R2744_02525 [Bacteroidales bacterium]